MPVKMKPTSLIKAQLGFAPNGPARWFFANECYKAMDRFVPMDKGSLRTIVDVNSETITYEMPYARYQFYGIREDKTHKVKNYTTPGTGPRWDKRMWSARGQDIIAKMQKRYGGK